MKKVELKGRNDSKHLATLLTAFALIFLGGVNKAQAQWSQPDTSGNINNTNSGNVGIGTGTTSPSRLLTISNPTQPIIGMNETGAGTDMKRWVQHAYQGSFYFQTVNDADNNGLTWMQVNRSGLNISSVSFPNGNIGIGTTGPNGGTVQIQSATPDNHLYLSSAAPDIVLGNNATRASATAIGYLGLATSANHFATGSAAGDLLVGTSQSNKLHLVTNGSIKVTVDGSGNVGIGTPTPNSSYKLDVNGSAHVTVNLNVDGNIAAKYQDVAEWVPSSHALSAGTVVILNPEKSNQVMASISAYDTRVAGVVSERPGLSLGEEGKDKALVATTGRVKVKVDATRAPIHVGDLLVTSDREGVAMKSEPVDLGGVKIHRPGTLIGKALENLEKGTGEILVLLSLQ